MKKLSDFTSILCLFITWKSTLYLISVAAVLLIPLSSTSFLGGGYKSYFTDPLLLGWANFDGEHYISIAQSGYSALNHSFFPLYPLILKATTFLSSDLKFVVISGIIISNVAFLTSLYLLFRLVRLDYQRKVAFLSVISLILFPTSFYFNSVYTESLFLLLTLGAFYSARVNKWELAGLLGMLSAATRIVGIMLFPVLLLELWIEKKLNLKNFVSILLVPVGLLFYMIYLYFSTGNALAFYNELSLYGVQRQGNFVLLPQVFYRYLNMFLTVDLNSSIYPVIITEFFIAIMSLALLFWGYIKRVRLSYLFFAIASFILPTLTGSFSSIPRYVLVIFPLFILMGVFLADKRVLISILIFSLLAISLIVEATFFLRGNWIA